MIRRKKSTLLRRPQIRRSRFGWERWIGLREGFMLSPFIDLTFWSGKLAVRGSLRAIAKRIRLGGRGHLHGRG